jgi:glucan phosphoethanolaminetransferase (alkaline phosphatase superfamily)
LAQQEDFTKKFRTYFKRIGPFRFFVALILILLGIGGKYIFFSIYTPADDTNYIVETTGTEIVLSASYFLSFWPLFWALIISLSLLWWVLSGFKSIVGVIVSLVVGIFMTEAMMPGTLFSFEEIPVYITLFGLILFAIPSSIMRNPMLIFKKPEPKKRHRFSSSHKKRRHKSSETAENGTIIAKNFADKNPADKNPAENQPL